MDKIEDIFGKCRYVDQDGFLHWHPVPPIGQFQLRSACTGCDSLDAITTFS